MWWLGDASSDYCGTCRAWAEADPGFEEFVARTGEYGRHARFDFSNDETTAAALALASELGIETLYEENAGRSGFVLVIDPARSEVLARISPKDLPSVDAQVAAVREVLGGD